MDVTLAICTWNRAGMLDVILGGLSALVIPPGLNWELLVVNNCCTDDTDAVLAKHAATLPIRRAYEPVAGIAHARNRVLSEARGRLLLWTDDDVRISDNWLCEFVRCARDFPTADVFGGPIRPWFADDVTTEQKKWTEAHLTLLAPVFSLKDYGPEVRPMTANEAPFSGSLGIRTAVAQKFRFNCQLGRVGRTGLLGAEEVLFLQDVMANGHTGVWVGSTSAYHYTPAERLTRDHLWRFYVAMGRTQAKIEGISACSTLWGRPRWAIAQYVKSCIAAWVARVGGRDWLAPFLTAARVRGYLDECRNPAVAPTAGYLIPPLRLSAP